MPPRSLRTRKALTPPSTAPAPSSRPRRSTAGQTSSTTIQRSSPDEGRHASIRLTVKSDPRKLQEATSGPNSKQSVAVTSRRAFGPGEIVSGPRQTRKKAIVEESSEEEEDEDEDENEEEEEDGEEGDPEEDELEDDEDEDAEGEDDDGEGEESDVDAEGEEDQIMVDAPPVRSIAIKPKPQVTVTPAAALLSVEDKEMLDDDDDDDELSSLDEDAEGELDDMGEEDAEGDDDDLSDEDASASRENTPDLTKLTRRQRGAFEDYEGGLIALSNGKVIYKDCLS